MDEGPNVPGRMEPGRPRLGRGRGLRGGSRGRPVKTVQIIRKVEYSSSLREEEPPMNEGSSADEPKKKCILLIVKKNKDDASSKRPRMTVEPTLAPLAPPGPTPPSTQRKGRYVKVRKEALQALPELRELIEFHRSKQTELIQENQLYDQKLALFGESSSLPGGPTPSRQFRAPPPPPPPPPSLPKGPGYLLALRHEAPEWGAPPPTHLAPPPRHLGPLSPAPFVAPRRPAEKENFSARKLEGFIYDGEPPEFPRLPAFEVRPPTMLDYQSVTVLGGDCCEPPLDSVSDSRAKKVLEEFDLLNSPEPVEPDEVGYEPNCSELDFASLEIVRGVGEDTPPEPQDPFLEEIFQVLRREVFDPFQQPTTLSSGSDVRGSKEFDSFPRPERTPASRDRSVGGVGGGGDGDWVEGTTTTAVTTTTTTTPTAVTTTTSTTPTPTTTAVTALTTTTSTTTLRWKCKLCGEKEATKNSLITHLQRHQQPFCRICLTVTSSEKKLRTHLLQAHPRVLENRACSAIVTSKYGRRRAVLDAATLYGRKRIKLNS